MMKLHFNPRPSWPAVLAAVAFGCLEWMALSRARLVARLANRQRKH
jgi:hypothetical protein